jgi:transposase InsO family protein
MQRIQDFGDHPQRDEIERRYWALWLLSKCGLKMALEFSGVSRASLFNWRKRYRQSGERLESLAPQSRRPKHNRPHQTDLRIEEFIRQYRIKHPGVGKNAIKSTLDGHCLKKGVPLVSESTVGRVLARLKKQGHLPGKKLSLRVTINGGQLVARQPSHQRKKLRRGTYMPKGAGSLVQIDSIAIFQDNLKRYLITAVDVVSRFGFAYGYSSLSSSAGADFLEKLIQVCPFPITHIQTDNGHEFDKHFITSQRSRQLIHFHNYPRHPQSNGHVERFNRTIRQQFLAYNDDELRSMDPLNLHLMEYLLWYNTEKPHRGIGNIPPLKYYLQSSGLSNPQSKMLWTLTVN